MSSILRFRALCDVCEAAEGHLWCKNEKRVLCTRCSRSPHAVINQSSEKIEQPLGNCNNHDIINMMAGSVISPLCGRCALAPAMVYCQTHSVCICELCASAMRELDPQASHQDDRATGLLMEIDEVGTADMKAKKDVEKEEEHVIANLKDTHVGDSFVFDKMDFSAPYLRPAEISSCSEQVAQPLNKRKHRMEGRSTRRLASTTRSDGSTSGTSFDSAIDLSYFKTKVPSSRGTNQGGS